MKLAVIACGNGLGHVKRLVKICDAIRNRAPRTRINLFCENWQIPSLESWNDFRSIKEETEITFVSIPIKWSSDPNFYGDWLWKWQSDILAWQLEKFDCVVSDNLVEPLLYANRVILSGSFLWHDVLSTAFPDSREVQYYKDWAENIMLNKRPDMIANKYFVMPALERQTNISAVGVISFDRIAENVQSVGLPKKIMIAFGKANNTNGVLEQLRHAIPMLDKLGVEITCSPEWYTRLSQYGSNIVSHAYGNYTIKADLAIVVGGLGTISDCIAAKVPMLYICGSNPELSYNLRQLSILGLGIPLQDALRSDLSPLTNIDVYNSMKRHFEDLMLHGETEVADILLTKFGGINATSDCRVLSKS